MTPCMHSCFVSPTFRMSDEDKKSWLNWASKKANDTKEFLKEHPEFEQKLQSSIDWSKDKAALLSKPETYNQVSQYLAKGYDVSKATLDRTREHLVKHPELWKYIQNYSVYGKDLTFKQIEKLTEMYNKNPDFYNGVGITLLLLYGMPYFIPGAAFGFGMTEFGLKETAMFLTATESFTNRLLSRKEDTTVEPPVTTSELDKSYETIETFIKDHRLFFPEVTFSSKTR